jgi:hypothetical protein
VRYSTDCGVAIHAHFPNAEAVTCSEQLVGTCGGELGVSQLEASKRKFRRTIRFAGGERKWSRTPDLGPPKHIGLDAFADR